MHATKAELRRMPWHQLNDELEATYLLWRFEDSNSALEGSLGIYLDRIIQEVARRRRRRLKGSCTCEQCWQFSVAFLHSEEL